VSKTLQDLIGYRVMTGIIQNPAGGIPANILPAEFTRVTRRITGNQCSWIQISGNRQVAQLVAYGDPAKRRNVSGVSERSAILGHTFEEHSIPAAVLSHLQAYDNPQRQLMGQQEIDRRLKEFRTILNNWRLAILHSVLANGKIWFDKDGNLLPSASGAAVTVDFGIPTSGDVCAGNIASNTGTKILTTAGAEKWSIAGTNIPKHVQMLQKLAARYTGYQLEYAFYGENVLGYLLSNTAIQTLFVNNGQLQASLMQGVIPDGFLGIRKWVPVDRAFYVDASGTVQAFFNPEKVVFTPAPTPEWWDVVEGTFPVPTNLGGVAADAAEAATWVDEVSGMFSYAVLTHNPVGLNHFYGDTFLALQRVTKAVFHATVNW